MVQELNFKLCQDEDAGTLMKLTDFLETEEVKTAGVTKKNVSSYITPSSILVVYNPTSTNTKARLCVAPNRKVKNFTGTINDMCISGWHHIP